MPFFLFTENYFFKTKIVENRASPEASFQKAPVHEHWPTGATGAALSSQLSPQLPSLPQVSLSLRGTKHLPGANKTFPKCHIPTGSKAKDDRNPQRGHELAVVKTQGPSTHRTMDAERGLPTQDSVHSEAHAASLTHKHPM